MSLKLFRSTEFAQSRNYSPEKQRSALHPAWLVVFTGFWLAVPGNWVLWHTLTQTPGLGAIATGWVGLRVAALVATASTGLLSIAMWRWTLKPAVTLALFVTALASIALGRLPGPASWQGITCLVFLAVVPCAWLWRTTVRRLPAGRNLLQVAALFACSCFLFALVLVFSFKDLAAQLEKHPEWREQMSPYSALGAVRALEKLLLMRKQ